MDQSIDIPWSKGMNFGMGVNLLNGDIAGKAVDPGEITGPSKAGGQVVSYNLKEITSLEELYTSIGISVEASAHYGLFSASGKFSYSNEVKFNSQSTFMLARCVVANAFLECEDAKIRADAADLVRQGKVDVFQNRFGDGFVRGMQTGGEFFAVISITSTSREEQTSVSADLKGSYGGVLATLDANLNSTTKSKVQKTDISISTYQRGGAGDEQAFTKDIEAVMARLKMFPKAVLDNPVPYDVQVARYLTLSLPDGPNPIDIEAQKTALETHARIRLKLLSLQNDIEFLQLHPDFFVDPPSMDVLNKWQEFVAAQLVQLKNQASRCVDNPKDGCVSFPFQLPPDFRMPERKKTNAITVKAGAGSFPKNLPMHQVTVPDDFAIQVRLVTDFPGQTAPGFMGVGLGLASVKTGRIAAILKGVGSGGRRVAGLITALDGTDQGLALGEHHQYSEDEVHFRMSKKGNQLIDMSFSRNGEEWTVFAENVDLPSRGFVTGEAYKVVLTGYSTCPLAVSGQFLDLKVSAI